MNLNIIGMRGTGKSNVSRRIAVATKRHVLSSDLLIEYETGETISQLVAADNGDWRTFRDLEFRVLEKIARLDAVIVDCGGGIVVDLNEHNEEVYSSRKVDLLRSTGPVIWLSGDIDRLAQKTRVSQTRPQLDQQRSAEETMRARLPFYEQAADVTIDIEGKERKQLAEEIVQRFAADLGVTAN